MQGRFYASPADEYIFSDSLKKLINSILCDKGGKSISVVGDGVRHEPQAMAEFRLRLKLRPHVSHTFYFFLSHCVCGKSNGGIYATINCSTKT
jgi:hypothetical protein